MATFQFDLVSPEKLLFSEAVDQVDVPGSEGDFGVLAGHAPLVAMLRPGILTVYRGGERLRVVVNGAEVWSKPGVVGSACFQPSPLALFYDFGYHSARPEERDSS